MKKYDIIAIGAGSGGLNIASFMNKVGFKVLLIDRSDEHIGGDCLNYGCVPSKALLHVAKVIKSTHDASRFGVKTSGSVDMKKVMGYVKAKQDVIREHENAAYFRKKGIDVALGKARFTGPNTVAVNDEEFWGKKIVLATGSRPRQLKIPGIDKVKFFTNETIFDIDFLPKNLVVIGGGPIGIELGQAFRRLGSEVDVIQNMPAFLPKETPEMAEVLHKQLEKEGMKFYFNCTPKEFTSKNEVLIEKKDGKPFKLKFDAVLVSIGRQLNKEGFDLEKAGIEYGDRKLTVDEYLRTTNKSVYCCGDIAGSFQFTHAAEVHAGVILSNFFNPLKKKKLSNDNLWWVTYTSPEIATFGLSEKELKERGIEYEKLELEFGDDDRAIVDEATHGKMILFVSGKLLMGGSMVAENAGELVQELVLVQSSRVNISKIFEKVYAYPTATRVNKKIIANYFSKKKLTPFAKKLLQKLY